MSPTVSVRPILAHLRHHPGQLALGAVLTASLSAWSAAASTPSDPFADAIDPTTSALVLRANAAIGAPDRQYATVQAGSGNGLVLDLGAGEEGRGDLVVHYLRSEASATTTAYFMNTQGQTVGSKRVSFRGNRPGANITTLSYGGTAPYRFVRFAPAANDYQIDAVATMMYGPDADADGLPDEWESEHGLDPTSSAGNDGANGDPDNDGLTNAQELMLGTDPSVADTDGDGLSDGAEFTRDTDPLNTDTDGDGLSENAEVAAGLDPLNAETDGDGITDGEEVADGTNPASADTDGDGLSDSQEAALGTNPTSADTDGDGVSDAAEVASGTNPTLSDTDGDGLTDGQEAAIGTNPLSTDSDGDGLSDGQEVALGTSPTNADSDGDGIPDGSDSSPDVDGNDNAPSGNGQVFLPMVHISR